MSRETNKLATITRGTKVVELSTGKKATVWGITVFRSEEGVESSAVTLKYYGAGGEFTISTASLFNDFDKQP